MGDTPTRPRGLIWPAFVTIFEAAWSIPGNLNNVVPTLGDKVLLKVGPKGTFREKTVFGKVTEVIGQTCLVKLSDSTNKKNFTARGQTLQSFLNAGGCPITCFG